MTLDISNEEDLKTELMEWDSVRVYSIWDIKYTDSVNVSGEVRNQGIYPLFDGTTLKDIVIQAGGFTKTALGAAAAAILFFYTIWYLSFSIHTKVDTD